MWPSEFWYICIVQPCFLNKSLLWWDKDWFVSNDRTCRFCDPAKITCDTFCASGVVLLWWKTAAPKIDAKCTNFRFTFGIFGLDFLTNLVDLYFSKFSDFCADLELALSAPDRRKNQKIPTSIGRPNFAKELMHRSENFVPKIQRYVSTAQNYLTGFKVGFSP